MSGKSDGTQILDPKPVHYTRSRNVLLLKSLGLITVLTILVLVVNYYLISNCPESKSTSKLYSPAVSADNSGSSSRPSIIPVTISVYYEILCPDSKSWILSQLVPVYQKYREDIIVDLHPFGKASFDKRGDSYSFTCQHGPPECYGNKLHACVINSTESQAVRVGVVACAMKNYKLWGTSNSQIDGVTQTCKSQHGDNSPLVCNNADQLLAFHGEKTLSLSPRASFIPTIAIDGSLDNQKVLLRDLDSIVCKTLKSRISSYDC